MKLLIAYASTEGQTRKIAQHIAERLFDAGHMVELLPLADAGDVDLNRFDRIILGASIHVGRYQRALAKFIEAHAETLTSKPTLLLSVSLAAAGHDAEDWKALDRIANDLSEATGWTPGRIEQVAGAYRPSEYDILTRFIMRRIIAAQEPDADLAADKEYTDWPALEQILESWIETSDPASVAP